MARVINPAIGVALILLAVAAGIAGVQAIFLGFDRPTEETASATPRAVIILHHLLRFQNTNYTKVGKVFVASSRPSRKS
jgi:uncharacterized membrane protein